MAHNTPQFDFTITNFQFDKSYQSGTPQRHIICHVKILVMVFGSKLHIIQTRKTTRSFGTKVFRQIPICRETIGNHCFCRI